MDQRNDKIIRDPLALDDISPNQRPQMVSPDPRLTGDDRIHPSAIFEGGMEYERVWRMPPRGASAQKVFATRWRAQEEQLTEAHAETPKDHHVIGLTLQSSNLQLSISDRVVLDGVAMPGTLLVTEPGVTARCIFKGPFDELHLYLSNDLIAECARELPDCREAKLRSELVLPRDPIIERLGRTLLSVEDIGGSFGQLYLESVSTAIIARLLSGPNGSVSAKRRKVTELVPWRLKRVIDYIETHLAEPVTSSDMARSTGLTRMHFAAQFRAATGLRPHEYLIRRRIERAQQLLLKTQLPLVEIALSVGFQSQSHFASVFHKFVGLPPRVWRLSDGDGSHKLKPRLLCR